MSGRRRRAARAVRPVLGVRPRPPRRVEQRGRRAAEGDGEVRLGLLLDREVVRRVRARRVPRQERQLGPALGGVEVAAAAALLEVDHGARRVDQVAEERSPLDQRLAFRGKVDPVEVLRVELLQAKLGISWPESLSLKYCPRAVLSPAGFASTLLVSQNAPYIALPDTIMLKLNLFFFFGCLTLCFVP